MAWVAALMVMSCGLFQCLLLLLRLAQPTGETRNEPGSLGRDPRGGADPIGWKAKPQPRFAEAREQVRGMFFGSLLHVREVHVVQRQPMTTNNALGILEQYRCLPK